MHGQHRLAGLAGAAGDALEDVEGNGEVIISGLAYDSRTVRDGDLFFCVPGAVADGHGFAPGAVSSGAAALCVERRLDLGVPEVITSDVRVAMARMSAAFYSYPALQLTMVGVTGT
ncbi:MAG: Mur ligase domain-containing protein, partial [Actinomycetota bacterium]